MRAILHLLMRFQLPILRLKHVTCICNKLAQTHRTICQNPNQTTTKNLIWLELGFTPFLHCIPPPKYITSSSARSEFNFKLQDNQVLGPNTMLHHFYLQFEYTNTHVWKIIRYRSVKYCIRGGESEKLLCTIFEFRKRHLRLKSQHLYELYALLSL